MNCADTLNVICSFLTTHDQLVFGNVSRLCRTASRANVSSVERQYFVGTCVKDEYVELAPPCRILALAFCEQERKLLVLAHSEVSAGETECCIFVQEAVILDGSCKEHRIDLPVHFAKFTSHVRFEGQRFLCCTTREGELFVFDCILESMIDLPFGCDGFHASVDGSRCLVDYDRHLFYCDSHRSLLLWWETHPVQTPLAPTSSRQCENGASFSRGSVDGATVVLKLRARLSLDHALLSYPLGNSSSAWRSSWVGRSSVLYAHENGVDLLRMDDHHHQQRHCMMPDLMPSFSVNEVRSTLSSHVVTETLGTLGALSGSLLLCSCSAVFSLEQESDEYVILDCRETVMYVITAPATASSPPILRTLHLKKFIPHKSIVKQVCVASPGCAYMVLVQQQQVDRALFISADLSLCRCITIGKPSAIALLGVDGVLITAALPVEDGIGDNLLLEAVEGGIGTIFAFLDEDHSCSIDTTRVTVKVALPSAAGEEIKYYKELIYFTNIKLPWPLNGISMESLNGVEALSWIAFGVVSASLVWTVSALCYNGWWLHLQLLFWGKVA